MRKMVDSNSLILGVVTGSLALIAGCATPVPTVDTSPEADVSFDGLHPVKGTRADLAWARPDVDISQYSKIMLQGAGIEYRPGGERGTTYSARSRGGPYEVTEKQKARLREVVQEKFVEELSKSEKFELVNEPGPDVLLVRGYVLDVVSFVPPEPMGRSAIYIREVGEATLVLELRDSITEAILARAVDRRAAESIGEFQKSNRAMNAASVRRLAGFWARLLRERLDAYKEPQS